VEARCSANLWVKFSHSQSPSRSSRMGRLRHNPGPDAHSDCLLKDAVHGVCSFYWRVDTLTVVYSPRTNIRPLSIHFLRCYLRTNNPFAGSDDQQTPANVPLLEWYYIRHPATSAAFFCHAESRAVCLEFSPANTRMSRCTLLHSSTAADFGHNRLTSNPCISRVVFVRRKWQASSCTRVQGDVVSLECS
jgi:hypothetical protein